MDTMYSADHQPIPWPRQHCHNQCSHSMVAALLLLVVRCTLIFVQQCFQHHLQYIHNYVWPAVSRKAQYFVATILYCVLLFMRCFVILFHNVDKIASGRFYKTLKLLDYIFMNVSEFMIICLMNKE